MHSDIELKTNNNITDINVSIHEISDIIQILHPNKAGNEESPFLNTAIT
jgi:hypothetical protein